MIFEKILIAADEYRASLQAVNLAAVLAREMGSPVKVVNVIPSLPEVPQSSEFSYAGSPYRTIAVETETGGSEVEESISSGLEQRAEAVIADARSVLDSEGVEAKTDIIRFKEPSEVLIDLAKQGDMDLVVMGNGEDDRWEMDTVGSVAMEVVKKALTSVLVVKRTTGLANISVLARDENSAAFRTGLEMAEIFDSQLDVVVPHEEGEAKAEELLRTLLQVASDAGLSREGRIFDGDEVGDLEEQIEETETELLVLEKPVSGALDRLVDRNRRLWEIVQKMPCSILLYREETG